MLCPPQTPSPLVANWLERHRHRGSFVLHILGIPVSVVGLLTLPIALPSYSLAVLACALGLFVAGYALQFLGHAIEGTDPGELMLIKRRLGWNVVEPAPARRPARAEAVSGGSIGIRTG